jgi:soluble lytic murein transglycosylase-like protein
MKLRLGLALAALLMTAPPARAELVFFSTGRWMSVASHRVEGDRIVLLPRDGGEMEYPTSLIAEPAAAVIVEASFVEPQSTHQYDHIIERVSAEEGVDARLVKAVIQVESNYKERARSPRGAMGLMQLMPETARKYAIRNPYDPESNIQAGIKHLKSLLDRFPVHLALAAYNAGSAAVERFRGIPPYKETRDYVARILQISGR